MITIATNLIARTSTREIDPVTKFSHASHNTHRFPMQQSPQQQHHYHNHTAISSDLELLHVDGMNNMAYYNDDQSFSQVITNHSSKSWSERILQDVTGLLHVLSPTGKILYCSSSCIKLTGFQPEELMGRLLTDFIHVDDLDLFIQNFQLAFNSLSRIKIHYRQRCKDDSFILLESIGHPKQDVANAPPQCFFAIAQPYLSASNELMDSYLEMKLENEWLKKRLDGILDMNYSPPVSAAEPTCTNLQINLQQPQYQLEPQQQQQQQQPQYTFYNNVYNSNDQQQPIYPQQQQHIQINHSSRRPSNCTVKMDDQWNYSPSVTSSSDLMNGYQTEESNVAGLLTSATQTSTTTTTPVSSQMATTSFSSSDNNLMAPADVVRKDKWKRRKKQKSVAYLCADCGSTSSPEWRKGPHGPKTLCNACGLRWAKKNKNI